MLGYRITLDDGTTRDLEASGYHVDDEGALIVVGGEEPIERFSSGVWLWVQDLGTPLSDEWPDPRIGIALRNVAEVLVVKWGYQMLGDSGCFYRWDHNEFDTFVRSVFRLCGIDPDTSDKNEKPRIADIRSIVAKDFGLRNSQT